MKINPNLERCIKVKKRSIVIGIIVLVAILLSIWLLNRPKTLGNMNRDFTEPETSTSSIGFMGEAGDRIKFSFRSDVEEGNLVIVLFDSSGNAVYELDKAKALETYFTLEKSDTYTLEAEYSDFIGSYKITIYKVE